MVNNTLFSGPLIQFSFNDIVSNADIAFKHEEPSVETNDLVQSNATAFADEFEQDEFAQPSIEMNPEFTQFIAQQFDQANATSTPPETTSELQGPPPTLPEPQPAPLREKAVRLRDGIRKTLLFFKSIKEKIELTHEWLTHKLIDRPYSTIFNVRTVRQIAKGNEDGTPIPEDELVFMELMRVIFTRTAKIAPWIVIKAAAVGGLAIGLGFAVVATAGAAGITLPVNPLAWGGAIAFFLLINDIMKIATTTISSLAGDRTKHIKYGLRVIKPWAALSHLERFRRIVWTGVDYTEKAVDLVIDRPISWLLRIRSFRQIRKEEIEALDNLPAESLAYQQAYQKFVGSQQLTTEDVNSLKKAVEKVLRARVDCKLSFLENMRYGVVTSIKDTSLYNVIPYISAGYIMDAIGLPIMTTALTIGFVVTRLLSGLVINWGSQTRKRRSAKRFIEAWEANHRNMVMMTTKNSIIHHIHLQPGNRGNDVEEIEIVE